MTHRRVRQRIQSSRGPRSSVVAALLASAIAAGSVSARAETRPTDAARAVQLNEAGSELYAAGDVFAALQAFERAYALVPEPNLLFNIAGCHERLGQREQAIEYYRWFLSSSSAQPEGRRRAIAALGRLEAEPARPGSAAPQQLPAAPASPAWPLATLGAGILFAGLGAGLYLDGAHDHNEVTNAPGFGEASGSSTLTEVRAKHLIDSGDTKKRIGAIGFGLGGALIATHVAVNLWRASAHESSGSSAELRLGPSSWSVAGKF